MAAAAPARALRLRALTSFRRAHGRSRRCSAVPLVKERVRVGGNLGVAPRDVLDAPLSMCVWRETAREARGRPDSAERFADFTVPDTGHHLRTMAAGSDGSYLGKDGRPCTTERRGISDCQPRLEEAAIGAIVALNTYRALQSLMDVIAGAPSGELLKLRQIGGKSGRLQIPTWQ